MEQGIGHDRIATIVRLIVMDVPIACRRRRRRRRIANRAPINMSFSHSRSTHRGDILQLRAARRWLASIIALTALSTQLILTHLITLHPSSSPSSSMPPTAPPSPAIWRCCRLAAPAPNPLAHHHHRTPRRGRPITVSGQGTNALSILLLYAHYTLTHHTRFVVGARAFRDATASSARIDEHLHVVVLFECMLSNRRRDDCDLGNACVPAVTRMLRSDANTNTNNGEAAADDDAESAGRVMRVLMCRVISSLAIFYM